MTNLTKVLDSLLHMHSQIEAIRVSDVAKIRFNLESMGDELGQIRKKEFDDIRSRLEGLALNLSDIRKKEIAQVRNKLHNLAFDLSLVRKKEFSFMKVFDLENNELVHSCVLAWLLDPLESHNFGSLFVKKFLEKVGINVNEFDCLNLQIEREKSSDNSRLDIRILETSRNFQCVIENKIWSREGVDQTIRLFSDFHDKSYEKELFIFLTLDQKSKPKNKKFISMNYEQVLEILKEVLDVSEGDTRFLIKHYANTLERLIMSEKFEGFSERTQLYYKYFKDTYEIKKAFENDRKLLLDTLEEALKNTSWWDENVWKYQRSGSDISLWKDSWYLNKSDGFYIQLYMYIENPGFAIRIYGEKSEFAAKIGSIFKRLVNEKYSEEILGSFKKTFGKGYTRFLEKEIRFSLTEKTQIEKILENLNEIIQLFDATIIQSINELK